MQHRPLVLLLKSNFVKSFCFFGKGLLASFITLTVTLILLNVLSNVLVDQLLNSRTIDEQLVVHANDQQMRSLQIIKKLTAHPLESSPKVLVQDSLIETLSITHLVQFADIKQSVADYSKELELIDRTYKGFYTALQHSIKEKSINNLVILFDKQNGYLQSLEAFIILVNNHSQQVTKRAKAFHSLMMTARIIIITAEAVFLFVPAVYRIKRQHKQLKQISFSQSHLVRCPLANIKGLLELMETASAEEKEELLLFAKAEASKLDEIIHTTVKEADDLSLTETMPSLFSFNKWRSAVNKNKLSMLLS